MLAFMAYQTICIKFVCNQLLGNEAAEVLDVTLYRLMLIITYIVHHECKHLFNFVAAKRNSFKMILSFLLQSVKLIAQS